MLFFARAREVAETGEIELDLAGDATNLVVLQQLQDRWPELKDVLKTCVLALNQEYINNGVAHPLKDGDELAVIPPVSGG